MKAKIRLNLTSHPDGTCDVKIENFKSLIEAQDFLDAVKNIIYSSSFGAHLCRTDNVLDIELKVLELLRLIRQGVRYDR